MAGAEEGSAAQDWRFSDSCFSKEVLLKTCK
jgi:hypothetical protein